MLELGVAALIAISGTWVSTAEYIYYIETENGLRRLAPVQDELATAPIPRGDRERPLNIGGGQVRRRNVGGGRRRAERGDDLVFARDVPRGNGPGLRQNLLQNGGGGNLLQNVGNGGPALQGKSSGGNFLLVGNGTPLIQGSGNAGNLLPLGTGTLGTGSLGSGPPVIQGNSANFPAMSTLDIGSGNLGGNLDNLYLGNGNLGNGNVDLGTGSLDLGSGNLDLAAVNFGNGNLGFGTVSLGNGLGSGGLGSGLVTGSLGNGNLGNGNLGTGPLSNGNLIPSGIGPVAPVGNIGNGNFLPALPPSLNNANIDISSIIPRRRLSGGIGEFSVGGHRNYGYGPPNTYQKINWWNNIDEPMRWPYPPTAFAKRKPHPDWNKGSHQAPLKSSVLGRSAGDVENVNPQTIAQYEKRSFRSGSK